MTNKPAGNIGANETPSETALWDRLRADLNNLGAFYGPLPEPASEAVARPEAVDYQAILLAARKRREALYDDDARELYLDDLVRGALRNSVKTVAKGRKVDEKPSKGNHLEMALSHPLDWEPRVGHRGAEIK